MENNMFSKLTEDVKQAMKDGNNCKRDCLRMVIAEIKNITVNAGKETTDEDCMRVLRKQAKTHEDSIAQFKEANRDELVKKEEAELSVIRAYLPKTLGKAETEAAVEKVIADNNFEKSKKMMGQIMKELSKIPGIDRKVAAAYLNKELH